jgi:hypothetical protein
VSAYWNAESVFDWEGFCQAEGGQRVRTSWEYLFLCPHCGKIKLSVNVRKRRWRCFVCSDGGRDAASMVAKVKSLPFSESVAAVITGEAQAVGRIDVIECDLREPRREYPVLHPIPWPETFVSFLHPPQPHVVPAWLDAVGYCRRRGIGEGVARRMRLGFCTHGRFRRRLLFPELNSGGSLLYYQARAMWESPRTKILSPKIPHPSCAGSSDCLLNLEYLRSRDETPFRVLVVEGPIDCAHAWPDAVSPWGKQLSPRHVELLVRAGVRQVDLGFDPEELQLTERQAAALCDLFTVRVVHWPSGQDPGDLTKDQIEACRARAQIWGSGARLHQINERLVLR